MPVLSVTSWFHKDMGDGMLAWQPVEEVKDRFSAAFREAGEPGDMALFIRHESEGRLHCHVMLYFSPGAASFAQAMGAEPCATPDEENLAPLAGAADWRALFSRGQ